MLDLEVLNKFVKGRQFGMVTLAMIIPALERETGSCDLNLQDAYFHFLIILSHQ